MVLAKNSSGDFELPEPGTYAAVCNKVIDIGTQEGEYKGAKIRSRKVILGWELTEKTSKGDPFQVSRWFTLSLNEKANLRPFLESWRGQAFNEQELEGFNLSVLLGKPCLLSIVKTTDGKIRAGNASKLPKGFPAPSVTTVMIDFDLDDFKSVVFESLGEKLKEMIRKSPEYAKATGAVAVDATHQEDSQGDAIEPDEVAF